MRNIFEKYKRKTLCNLSGMRETLQHINNLNNTIDLIKFTALLIFLVTMGGHGHGHGEPYKVPDASKYKVEDVPKLAEVQEALARQGLKDPWLR